VPPSAWSVQPSRGRGDFCFLEGGAQGYMATWRSRGGSSEATWTGRIQGSLRIVGVQGKITVHKIECAEVFMWRPWLRGGGEVVECAFGCDKRRGPRVIVGGEPAHSDGAAVGARDFSLR